MKFILILALAGAAGAKEPLRDPRVEAAASALKAAGKTAYAKAFLKRIVDEAEHRKRRGGCAVSGRVSLDGPGDPEAVTAQMQIYPGGWYADYFDPKGRPLAFRAPGYDPVDLRPACPAGGGIAWTDVRLARTPQERRGAVTARLEMPGGGDWRTARVSVYPTLPETNEPEEVVDALPACETGKPCPSIKIPSIAPPAATVDASGLVKAEDLSPMEHAFSIKAPEYVPFHSTFMVRPGTVTDAGTLTLERARRISLRYLIARVPPFKGKPRESTAWGGQFWSSKGNSFPGELNIDQQNDKLFIGSVVGPSAFADLGEGRVEDFAHTAGHMSIAPDSPRQRPLIDGHVYLLRSKYWPHWMLVETRVDR